MDLYPFKGGASCQVCGGPGDADARTVYSASAVHIDPRMCRNFLAAEKRRLEDEKIKIGLQRRALVGVLPNEGIEPYGDGFPLDGV